MNNPFYYPTKTKLFLLFKISGYAIYDCDTGADDAWGLIMLAKAEEIHNKITEQNPKMKKFKLLAITCVNGNSEVDNTTRNTLRVLKSINRLDIPVFKGCSETLIPPTWKARDHFHGIDGFGDLDKDKDNENDKHDDDKHKDEAFGFEDDVDESLIQPQHAVEAMYYYACKYPRMVDYILVGPLTNFAMCINLYGENFLQKVRRVFIMGGNTTGRGNLSKSAEFNFLIDPEAAYVVLERSNVPLIILPYETCIDRRLGISLEWRFSVPGAVNSKVVKLLNRVEKAIFMPKNFVDWLVCDAMLVAAYLFPTLAIVKILSYHVTVELHGKHTRGQMVLDHLREKENNAILIMKINGEMFKKIAAWTVGVEGADIQGDLA